MIFEEKVLLILSGRNYYIALNLKVLLYIDLSFSILDRVGERERSGSLEIRCPKVQNSIIETKNRYDHVYDHVYM